MFWIKRNLSSAEVSGISFKTVPKYLTVLNRIFLDEINVGIEVCMFVSPSRNFFKYKLFRGGLNDDLKYDKYFIHFGK